MNCRERREQQRAEAANKNPDFPGSLASPRSDDSTTPLYCATWVAGNGKITGNNWTSKQKAVEVRDKKLADGSFRGTVTTYCAGFVL